jgi:hypothetical protein
MNTIPPGSEQFEDRLLTAILEDFHDITRTTSATARHHSTRRIVIQRVAPAMVAGVAVIAVVAANLPAHAHHAPADATRVTPSIITQPQLHTAAYIVAKMKAAESANDAGVLYETDRAPDATTGAVVHSQEWTIPGGTADRLETTDAAGNPIHAYVSNDVHGQDTVVSVDYAAHTWSTTTYSDAPAGGSAPLPQSPQQGASQLRADQASGKATVLGLTTVDGQNALELKEGSLAAGEQLTWVDASTYLPIRELDTAPGQPLSSDENIQADYQWLPATAANLALVTPATAIPAGFTEVSPGAHQHR